MTSTERRRLGRKLADWDVKQPLVTIEEALRADIRVASALAMLEMETGIPQRNIFGCDHGPGTAFCHQNVTEERVKDLLNSGLSNGVGWTQLTYRPFVLKAVELGGAHIPRIQMRVGFQILRDNYDRLGSIREMYRAYNGSGSAAEAYATKAVGLRHKWLDITEGN